MYSKKYQDNSVKNNFEKIVALYKDKPVDSKLEKLIFETFSNGIDLVTADSIQNDLKQIINNKTYLINDTFVLQ